MLAPIADRGSDRDPRRPHANRLDAIASNLPLERRLRADMSKSALLDILDAIDDRPKAQLHELRPPASQAT